MKLAVATVVGALFASLAFAAPALPPKYVVRVKVGTGKAMHFVPVGEVTRAADGTVAAKGLAAPELDAMTKQFVADWNGYKHPTSVKLTENVALSTGMRPTYKKLSFTWTPKDTLFEAAVIREFLAKKGYVAMLGMETVDFVEFDSTSDDPPEALDRGSTHSNFRKGTHYPHAGGHTFYIGKRIRTYTPPGEGRLAASNPKVAVATGLDAGNFEVGRITVFDDGRVEVKPSFAGPAFESAFGPPPTADVDVRTIVKGEWKTKTVKKTSPQLLEAFLIERFDYYVPYDVSPAIDPLTIE